VSRPRRILHVDKFGSRSGGGATGYMLEIVGRQRAQGHHVEFLATDGPTDLDTALRHLFPPRPQLEPPPPGIRDRITTAAQMVWSRRAAAAMHAAIEAFRPDVVHAHNLYHQLSPSVLRPLRRAGIPVVMTVHDYKLVCPTYRLVDGAGTHCEACVGGPSRVVNVVRRRCQGGSAGQSAVLMAESGLHRLSGAYDPIDTFLCPSAYLAGLLGRSGLGDRTEHLPHGYDLSTIPARTGPGQGVVFAGRLSREKGLDHLVEALALLPDVQLTVCGDGPQRAEWEALADRRIPGRARFLGHLDRAQVLEHVRSAAVLAVPSVWAENQPLSIIEAMASGVPVVSGDAPPLREMVHPDETGRTANPRDHQALADALATFVHDLELQRRVAVTARSRAERTHDMNVHLQRLDEIYERCRGRTRVRGGTT
jgi:glycosyltransferase involved in cell wall biosynthesis